jgi:hypothetical protein
MSDMTDTKINGYRSARLSMLERDSLLIRRAWTKAERRIVIQGFLGRLVIAIEPAICGAVFLALTLGMVLNKNKGIIILAPIFGLGVLAFGFYAFAVMLAPVRALLHTLGPIYIVDGYVRYRGRDAASDEDSNGYIAVMTEDGRVACEWPTLGSVELPNVTRPSLCEFSEYGGVHSIDGRSTGVLPGRIPSFGVGGRSRERDFTEDP